MWNTLAAIGFIAGGVAFVYGLGYGGPLWVAIGMVCFVAGMAATVAAADEED